MQRSIMNNDGLQATISTGSAAIVFGLTWDVLVLILWAIYILILIAIKLPELPARYPIIGRLWNRLCRRARKGGGDGAA